MILKKRKEVPNHSARVSDSNEDDNSYEDRRQSVLSLKDGSISSDTSSMERRVLPLSPKKPSGLILKSGRLRLPDKMIEYLNKEVVPEVLYWREDGEAFFIDVSSRADADVCGILRPWFAIHYNQHYISLNLLNKCRMLLPTVPKGSNRTSR